jgi:hypothetical protein
LYGSVISLDIFLHASNIIISFIIYKESQMGIFSKNKKEKFSIEIDKDLYADFCVKCAQTNVNDVIECLIKDYLKPKKAEISTNPIIALSTKDKKSNFKYYLTQVAHKTTGDHYSENVSDSYSSAVNKSYKYFEADLWEMDSSTELSESFSKVQKNDDFIQQDKKTQRTLSNGIKRYIEFLEYLENSKN